MLRSPRPSSSNSRPRSGRSPSRGSRSWLLADMPEADARRGGGTHAVSLPRAFFVASGRNVWGDRLFQACLYAVIALFVAIMAGIVGALVVESLPPLAGSVC